VLVLGSAVTRYRYTEPCELGDAGVSQVLVAGSSGGWLHKEWYITGIFMDINVVIYQ